MRIVPVPVYLQGLYAVVMVNTKHASIVLVNVKHYVAVRIANKKWAYPWIAQFYCI